MWPNENKQLAANFQWAVLHLNGHKDFKPTSY